MKLDNYIVCLLGKSGSGKTTIADKLNKEFGYIPLKSYTTRNPRHKDDTDHVFITEEEYHNLNDMVAYTYFNGNYYCATKEQVDNSDIYVIDLDGLKQLKQLYNGHKEIISIYIDVPMEECLERMRNRGDSEDSCWSRLRHDDSAFKGVKGECEYSINGLSPSTWLDVYAVIQNHIKKREGMT